MANLLTSCVLVMLCGIFRDPAPKVNLISSRDTAVDSVHDGDKECQGKTLLYHDTLRESIEVLHGKKQKLDCIFEQ